MTETPDTPHTEITELRAELAEREKKSDFAFEAFMYQANKIVALREKIRTLEAGKVAE